MRRIIYSTHLLLRLSNEFLLDSKTDNKYDFSKERRDEESRKKVKKKGIDMYTEINSVINSYKLLIL